MTYLDKPTIPKILIPILITFLFLCASTSSYAQTTYHVNASSGNDTNDGLSWTNAFLTLQKAIDEAVVNDEIWVAEGTYLPSKESDGTTDSQRDFTFFIDFDVKIYGGFPNTGTPTMAARNWIIHKTILSGDFNNDDILITNKNSTNFPAQNNGENAYTIINTKHVSSDFLMDGFGIEGGNANTFSIGYGYRGGGWLNDGSGSGKSSNPTIQNCIFQKNTAVYGGAMYNGSISSGVSSPTLTNCIFQNNRANENGGAIYHRGNSSSVSFPTLTNCSFQNNNARDYGGAVFNRKVSGTITNCSFQNNQARLGGVLSNIDCSSCPTLTNCSFQNNKGEVSSVLHGFAPASTLISNCSFQNNVVSASYGSVIFSNYTNFTVTNCIFWQNGKTMFGLEDNDIQINYSLLEEADCPEGTTCNEGVIYNQDPLFVDSANGDLHLDPCSPAVNVGDGNSANSANTTTTDLGGNLRFYDNGIIDMGAYERQGSLFLPTSITGHLAYCTSDLTTTLDAGNWTSYKWSNGETSQAIEASEGIYTVTVTNSNGCTGTDEVSVTENENPNPSISGDSEYCTSDNSTTLHVETWKSYKWSNGETTQMIEATEGTYTITVTNSNDCTGINEFKVTENANPMPKITGTFDYCRGREATLDAGTWINYQWSNGEMTQSFSTTSIGVYTVTVTNQKGCTNTTIAEVTATPCLAEAGTLTTNAATICGGGNIEVSTTGEQTGTNYPQYFFLYTQDNLGITSLQESMIADYGTGKAAATFEGLEAGDYLVCAYNECQNCLPNPSPITSNLDNIYQTGTIQDGCFDIECTTMNVPEAFTHNVESSGAAPITGTEMTLFIAEVCGGTAPHSMNYDFSNGFISVQEYPSENAGCVSYQVTYTQGTDWTLTVTDAHNCGNENVVFTSSGLPSTPLPQITNDTTSPETCIGDEDGSITIEVEGGDISCNEFTYTWSGFNNVNETATGAVTGNILENIAAGMYAVTVTDCAGTTTVQTGINVTRSSGRGRGRGRGGCKTGAELEENFQLFASPNPFSNHTLIEFSLVETSKVWLSVYSMDGRKVATLLQGETIEGEAWQLVDFEANSLQNGIYILELQTEKGVRFQEKLMILE